MINSDAKLDLFDLPVLPCRSALCSMTIPTARRRDSFTRHDPRLLRSCHLRSPPIARLAYRAAPWSKRSKRGGSHA
jgi:hypothetical protein